jgi:SAM-dependent methyltransferase
MRRLERGPPRHIARIMTSRARLREVAARVSPLVSAVRRGRISVVRAKEFAAQVSLPLWIGKYRDEPPPWLRFEGPTNQDWRRSGEGVKTQLVDLAGLTPDSRVLDVGSGNGRVAMALTGLLRSPGSYDGIEIVKPGVIWCRAAITARWPNFRFHHADIANRAYNPRGKTPAADYRFPFTDRTFDVVVLASVFTHLLPNDAGNYLAEIGRVLRDDGRCLSSWFIYDPETVSLADCRLSFPVVRDGYALGNAEVPELAVAYTDSEFERLHAAAALKVDAMWHGNWKERAWPGAAEEGLQDLVVSRRC